MKLPLISAIALTAGMLMSGSAMAQTAFGSATLTAEELPIVQAHCDTLARVDNTGNSASNDNKTAGASEEVDAADSALVTSISLDDVTLEQCEEAGLVGEGETMAAEPMAAADTAPTMVGTVALTAEELPIVQAHCDTLEAKDNTGNSASNDSKNTAGDEKSDAPEGDQALVTSVVLDEMTIEDCKEAGLLD